MADLDISEKRVPQDGRFALTVDGPPRRHPRRHAAAGLRRGRRAAHPRQGRRRRRASSRSACRTHELERFARAIKQPERRRARDRPDGLGQVDDALRGAATSLNDGERSILTIEDPVEQRIAGVKQMQIAPKAGVTFDVGLRSMLRADPDVIMVGEIRDRETAHIAVEAALTGHLVLSTLHTRDAPSALGPPDRHGHRAVPGLLGGRLHRRPAARAHALHSTASSRRTCSEAVLAEYGLAGAEPFEAVGCSRCGGSRLPRARRRVRGDDASASGSAR